MRHLLPTTPATAAAGTPAAAWLRLDASALLVDASPTALAMLEANAEVLLLQCQRLRATRQPERLCQALLLARAHGRWPLALVRGDRLPLTLLCARSAPDDPAAGWHVSLRDPAAERPDPHLVQALFDLTPSEAAVATALALGQSTGEIALAWGVQPNTVLAHVKKVLTKTGTQRQAQLVSLLLRSVAVRLDDGHTPPDAGRPASTRGPLAQPGNDGAERPAHTADKKWAPDSARQPIPCSGNAQPARRTMP